MGTVTASELTSRIETDIRGGRLRAGDRLPSVRHQADTLGLSPTTVAAAYRRLRERGLVIGRGRQGTRVAPTLNTDAGRAPSIPKGAIDAMSGNPDPHSLPILEDALRLLPTATPARYGDSLVHPDLATTGRSLFTRDGIDAGHMTVTSGAMHAIELMIATEQYRIGDRLAVEDPGHIPVHQLGRRAGMTLEPVAVDDDGMLPDSLARALAGGAAAVVITPRAQNPTGAALGAARAEALSRVLADHPDVLLVVDDHAGMVSGAAWTPIEPPGDRWAVVRSLGKSHGPDLRLALVAGDATTIDRIEAAVGTGAGWVSHLLQRTAALLLDDADVTRLVDDAGQRYTRARDRAVAGLASRGVPASGRSGLNVWVPVADEQAAIEAARATGFAVRGGDPYRLTSPAAIRLTISSLSDEQIDELVEAVAAHLCGPGASLSV